MINYKLQKCCGACSHVVNDYNQECFYCNCNNDMTDDIQDRLWGYVKKDTKEQVENQEKWFSENKVNIFYGCDKFSCNERIK